MANLEKIIFLDIDGVLVTQRSAVAFGATAHSFEPTDIELLDWVGVGLVRRACEDTGAQIVLSSSWRHDLDIGLASQRLRLPIIDKTPDLQLPLDDEADEGESEGAPPHLRGREIEDWLRRHPQTGHFAILDDYDVALDHQRIHMILINAANGIEMHHFSRLRALLGGDPRVPAAIF